MPKKEGGRPARAPKPKPVKPPKPVTQVIESAVDQGLKVATAAQKSGERKTAVIKKKDVTRFLQAPAGGTVDKAKKQFTKAFKADVGKRGDQTRNAKQFGFKDTSTPTRKKRSGGTSTQSGGGGGLRDRSGARRDTGLQGANDGGRLGGNFRDRDLVGSENTITEFDGSEFSGGFDDVEGGGGGSGSSLAGRESVGKVGDMEGKSLDEVVYGVKKRSRKVGRARGE